MLTPQRATGWLPIPPSDVCLNLASVTENPIENCTIPLLYFFPEASTPEADYILIFAYQSPTTKMQFQWEGPFICYVRYCLSSSYNIARCITEIYIYWLNEQTPVILRQCKHLFKDKVLNHFCNKKKKTMWMGPARNELATQEHNHQLTKARCFLESFQFCSS